MTFPKYLRKHLKQMQHCFVLEHFDEIQMPVVQQNLRIYTAIEAIIVSHFIVEGLTRNYTAPDIQQGASGTVDE